MSDKKDEINKKNDDKGKGKVEGDLARANQAKQAGDDVDLVDADDVNLFDALDLENRVTKLEEDFTSFFNCLYIPMLAEVVQVSSDESFSGDEDVVSFNDVKYHLTDAKIRMFKETLTTSRGPKRQLSSTSTRSRAHIAFTTSRGPRCTLALFAPNAPPPFPIQKKSKP
ncbi:hypothetical protein Tco_1302482 [Tanacetum coccineum]